MLPAVSHHEYMWSDSGRHYVIKVLATCNESFPPVMIMSRFFLSIYKSNQKIEK
jgi:hypothetical protein